MSELFVSSETRLYIPDLKERFASPYEDKIVFNEDAAAEIIERWHREGLKIVVTDGVMDIPTVKHPEALRLAANLGDRLVLRLDTDDYEYDKSSFKNSPINKWELRAMQAAHYPYVDLIVSKKDEDPGWLKKFRPDVIVKSTTSWGDIEQDLKLLDPYLAESGAELVVFDEYFMRVPRSKVDQRAKEYQAEKRNHVSGSNLRAEIVRRGT